MKTVQKHILIPEDLLKKAEDQAQKEDLSFCQFVRKLIKAHLAKVAGGKK
jgi:hypothetical protein